MPSAAYETISASQSPTNWPYNLSSSARSGAGPSACRTVIRSEDFEFDICASLGLLPDTESDSNAAIKQEDLKTGMGTSPRLDKGQKAEGSDLRLGKIAIPVLGHE